MWDKHSYVEQQQSLYGGKNLFKNKTSGGIYEVIYIGLNATKGQMGQTMAVYRIHGTHAPIFVREYGEFAENFDPITHQV